MAFNNIIEYYFFFARQKDDGFYLTAQKEYNPQEINEKLEVDAKNLPEKKLTRNEPENHQRRDKALNRALRHHRSLRAGFEVKDMNE